MAAIVVVEAAPPLPSSFYGTVLVNGANVPDGTVVSAWIDGVNYVDFETITFEGASVYSFDVPGDDPDTPEKDGGIEGDTIVFMIGSDTADQTATWHTGTNVELNLTATSEPTAPTISGLPDQFFDQDNLPPSDPIDLWAYAEDAETPDSELIFTIEGSPPTGAGVTLTDNRDLLVDPSFDWCGYIDVTVRVTDPGGLWDEDTLRVAVTWVCKGPLPVANQLAPQNEAIVLDLTDYEPQIGDGTGMYWYVTGQKHCTVSGVYSEDDVLTFTPHLGFVGSEEITLHMTYPMGGEATQVLTLSWWDAETQGFRLYLPVATRGQ